MQWQSARRAVIQFLIGARTVANLVGSAFYSDSLRLDLKDVADLLLGRTIMVGGLVIGYERQPDNGCQCPNCSEIFAAERSTNDRETSQRSEIPPFDMSAPMDAPIRARKAREKAEHERAMKAMEDPKVQAKIAEIVSEALAVTKDAEAKR